MIQVVVVFFLFSLFGSLESRHLEIGSELLFICVSFPSFVNKQTKLKWKHISHIISLLLIDN